MLVFRLEIVTSKILPEFKCKSDVRFLTKKIKFRIYQKFKISQQKVFNCPMLDDFCFKFLTVSKFKIQ
jgi:hypothetical protein